MWVGQHLQIDFMKEVYNLLNYRPTEHLPKHKNMQFATILNVLMSVDNHLSGQWLKAR